LGGDGHGPYVGRQKKKGSKKPRGPWFADHERAVVQAEGRGGPLFVRSQDRNNAAGNAPVAAWLAQKPRRYRRRAHGKLLGRQGSWGAAKSAMMGQHFLGWGRGAKDFSRHHHQLSRHPRLALRRELALLHSLRHREQITPLPQISVKATHRPTLWLGRRSMQTKLPSSALRGAAP